MRTEPIRCAAGWSRWTRYRLKQAEEKPVPAPAAGLSISAAETAEPSEPSEPAGEKAAPKTDAKEEAQTTTEAEPRPVSKDRSAQVRGTEGRSPAAKGGPAK